MLQWGIISKFRWHHDNYFSHLICPDSQKLIPFFFFFFSPYQIVVLDIQIHSHFCISTYSENCSIFINELC